MKKEDDPLWIDWDAPIRPAKPIPKRQKQVDPPKDLRVMFQLVVRVKKRIVEGTFDGQVTSRSDFVDIERFYRTDQVRESASDIEGFKFISSTGRAIVLDDYWQTIMDFVERNAAAILSDAASKLWVEATAAALWAEADDVTLQEFLKDRRFLGLADDYRHAKQATITRIREMDERSKKDRENRGIISERGRGKGQKDRTPRRPRTTPSEDQKRAKTERVNAEHKKKILRAIEEYGREPVTQPEIAPLIGITDRALREWIKHGRWEWENLKEEGLRQEEKRKIIK